ncbi:hypothetical protein [Nostoc sp. PCC 7107]|uniref:hypothetical protein n=1 Tax=Nostoc sp. PCC 7107 TaxID=317936 RepID=UPI00029F1584|nr:hypothetical protein [Nostoc sp. PCC 7107]AFY45836.1 hypothetical protein Nos7107_5351 [Nostoc sp. PCC 7107]
MFHKAGFGLLLGVVFAIVADQAIARSPSFLQTEAIGQTSHHPHSSTTFPTNQFQRLNQPLENKVAVTLGGLSLIGLQLWWFLLSKPKS